MFASWVGRSLLAFLAWLAAAGLGLVVAGATGDLRAGLWVAAVALVVCGIRASRAGVLVDVDRGEVVLRTCWRTRRIPAAELERVDAGLTRDAGLPGLRFLTADGRSWVSLAVVYLPDDRAEELVTRLEAMRTHASFELDLDRSSFRPQPG
jgi:hypothetical protein